MNPRDHINARRVRAEMKLHAALSKRPRPSPDEIAAEARRAREQALLDHYAGQVAAGIADRVLFNQRVEDIFLRGCKTKAARDARAAQLPAFCASFAWDVAEALVRERRRRLGAAPSPKF